jgi:hypothetical protein
MALELGCKLQQTKNRGKFDILYFLFLLSNVEKCINEKRKLHQTIVESMQSFFFFFIRINAKLCVLEKYSRKKIKNPTKL